MFSRSSDVASGAMMMALNAAQSLRITADRN